jgi:hypothetical protein
VEINCPLFLKFFICPNPLVLSVFYVMNYSHLVYGMQMVSTAQAWMYRQPQEHWVNFLCGVNGFLNQAEADMITHIHNGHETTTITTTSHRSREMAVAVGSQRTLVTGTKTEPIIVTQHQRHVL